MITNQDMIALLLSLLFIGVGSILLWSYKLFGRNAVATMICGIIMSLRFSKTPTIVMLTGAVSWLFGGVLFAGFLYKFTILCVNYVK